MFRTRQLLPGPASSTLDSRALRLSTFWIQIQLSAASITITIRGSLGTLRLSVMPCSVMWLASMGRACWYGWLFLEWWKVPRSQFLQCGIDLVLVFGCCLVGCLSIELLADHHSSAACVTAAFQLSHVPPLGDHATCANGTGLWLADSASSFQCGSPGPGLGVGSPPGWEPMQAKNIMHAVAPLSHLSHLAGAQSLVLALAEHGGAGADFPGASAAGPVPPRVAREATLLLLKAARALHSNSHLLVRAGHGFLQPHLSPREARLDSALGCRHVSIFAWC